MTTKGDYSKNGFWGNWIGEENEDLGIKILLKSRKVLYVGKSEYNPRIYIIDTDNFGKVLLLGDEKNLTLQYSEKWDFYDEMLAHVPLCAHGAPEKVLIIGGGDGGVLKEVLKYNSVKRVVLVEIDKVVVDISKKFFEHSWAFEDPRVEIKYLDGAKYVEFCEEKFDVVIGDYTDPVEGSPASSLITEKFFKNLSKILKENGLASMQSGSPILQMGIMGKIFERASKFFKISKLYLATVPIYPGGIWSFIAFSQHIDPSKPRCKPPDTKYYNREIHISSFKKPTFLKNFD